MIPQKDIDGLETHVVLGVNCDVVWFAWVFRHIQCHYNGHWTSGRTRTARADEVSGRLDVAHNAYALVLKIVIFLDREALPPSSTKVLLRSRRSSESGAGSLRKAAAFLWTCPIPPPSWWISTNFRCVFSFLAMHIVVNIRCKIWNNHEFEVFSNELLICN